MQGPDAWAEQYGAVFAEFETIARREDVQYLYEGGPSLEEKLKGWRDSVRVKQSLLQIKEGEVTIRPLAPEWRFATDPKDAGVKGNWFAVGLDDSQWATVRSDKGNGWEAQGFADYLGLGWYRQQITLPTKPARKHAYLYFGAVDEDALVYLNGQQAFEHSCASTGLSPDQIWNTPFVFDAAGKLRPGQSNTLAVRVLNRLGMGGIYLPVYLVLSDHELDAPLIQALLARR
ncbi:MAG: sugar-binding domain-containing protein [Armatimonadota bacterium]